jgi:hypothetical protein
VFEEGTAGYLLIKALRCHIEVDIYASLEVHTEETIASGREKLTHFYESMSVSPLFIASHIPWSQAGDPWYRHTLSFLNPMIQT